MVQFALLQEGAPWPLIGREPHRRAERAAQLPAQCAYSEFCNTRNTTKSLTPAVNVARASAARRRSTHGGSPAARIGPEEPERGDIALATSKAWLAGKVKVHGSVLLRGGAPIASY